LICAGEAIDILLAMKGKLIKEEKRHLDDARRDKQVKEHVVQQAQELPPAHSSFLPLRSSMSPPSPEVILPPVT